LLVNLEKDEHNIYHAYLDFNKYNAIVTANHCFKKFKISEVKFKHSLTKEVHKLLKGLHFT